MRKVLFSCIVCLIPMIIFGQNDPTPLQMVYVIKKIFPEVQEITVFIDKNEVNTFKSKFNQAGVSKNLQIKMYPIDTAADIGNSIKNVPENSTLLIMNNEVLTNTKSRLYILSKSKEKNIKLVSSSQDYVDSGALIGIIMTANNEIKIIVNIKHCPQFKSKFTSSFIEQAGIAAVIEN